MPEKVSCERLWCDDEYARDINVLREKFDADLAALDQGADFIFDLSQDAKVQAGLNEDLLREWIKGESVPSLAALSVFALERWGMQPDPDLQNALMMAAVLGEVGNDLPYHSNMHYRKVLLQLVRLITAHNHVYADTRHAFSVHQVCLLLIAACIHDYGHDGKGNTVKGVFTQSRLELRSYRWAEPFLIAAGLQDKDDLQALKIMLLCTDVSPLGEPDNPMHQMKAAYRYHYHGGKSKTLTLGLDADLVPLENNAALTLMSLILHEADIATSAGLTYAVTKYETAILGQEFGKEIMRPSDCLDFLERVCDRQFLSHAGQELYSAQIARNCALAEEEVASGDAPLPAPEQSDFLMEASEDIPLTDSQSAGDSKTIN